MADRWDGVSRIEEAAHVISGDPCVCEGMGCVRADVQVGHPLFGKAIQCPCKTDAVKRVKAVAMMQKSGLTKNMIGQFTFAGFNPWKAEPLDETDPEAAHKAMAKALDICRDWAAHPDGWLILSGVKGCGKTHLAIAIAGQQLRAARGVYYNTAISTLNLLRSSYEHNRHDEYIKFLREVDVLVVDDLGAERRNDWTDEQLLDILDHRHIERKPVIITTNVFGENDQIAPRLRSRMREGTAREDGFVRELALPAGDYRPNVGYRKGGT